ncbi:MAG: hypothetical protein JXE07_03320 [Candidatus Aminicenantes bacterium]|nr:hypothetical protein [Candidatus Aminicenantes bacterium]
MNRIKTIAFLAALSLFSPSFSGAADLMLRLSAGLDRTSADEVNRALAGWREGWRLKTEGDPNLTLENETSGALHLGVDFEAELLLSFSRWLTLGLGAGCSFASLDERQTRLSIRQDGALFDYTRPTKISAYPVFLSAYVFLPLGQKFKAYLRAGMGAIFARNVIREASKKAEAGRFSYTAYHNAGANGTGYIGGLGLSYAFDESLGFFAEASFRRAEVSGFEGENSLGESGALYIYEEYDPDVDFWQLRMSVHAAEPGGEAVRDVRKATVDFGGYSVRIGLSLKL